VTGNDATPQLTGNLHVNHSHKNSDLLPSPENTTKQRFCPRVVSTLETMRQPQFTGNLHV